MGDTVVFGNFSQTGLQYKEDVRVIEFVKDIAENFPLANGKSLSAAQFLERFLFTPDQQYTYLSKLSGGEKKRLQLLSILFRNPNFLILDEPTNDLDLPTLSVLEEFLSDYNGCILLVSHDRYFMDRLVDHLFVFEGEGAVRDFPGNYSQYRIELRERERAASKSAPQPPTNQQPATSTEQPAPTTQQQGPRPQKLSYKEQRELEQLDKDLPALEAEKAALAADLSTGTLPYDVLQQKSDRIRQITDLLEEKELRWLELSERA
jgi:ATP-binding cassette subfamily F protein uup